MVDCAYCGFKGKVLFENDHLIVSLPLMPAVPGHVLVFPRQHVQILEQASDDSVTALFDAANKVSVSLFEGLSAQGTNVMVMNGLAAGQVVAHLAVHIIPRFKDDGIVFSWPGKKISDEQMGLIEAQVKDNVFSSSLSLPPPKEVKEEEKDFAKEEKRKEMPRKTEDLFVKNIRRLP